MAEVVIGAGIFGFLFWLMFDLVRFIEAGSTLDDADVFPGVSIAELEALVAVPLSDLVAEAEQVAVRESAPYSGRQFIVNPRLGRVLSNVEIVRALDFRLSELERQAVELGGGNKAARRALRGALAEIEVTLAGVDPPKPWGMIVPD